MADYRSLWKGPQTPQRIVLHTTEGDSAQGALSEFQKSGYGAQVVIDQQGNVIRVVPDNQIAYSTGGNNTGTLAIEIVGHAGQSSQQWMQNPAQLRAVANQIRQWSQQHKIPLSLSTVNGVSTHAMNSRLYSSSEGHWDPGPNFPLTEVMRAAGANWTPQMTADALALPSSRLPYPGLVGTGIRELPNYTGQPGAGVSNLPNAAAGATPVVKALGNRVSQWPASALLAYQLAVQRGATPAQAKDFAAVQYGESGFDPNARNKSSGAAGLYQLLSSGYVNRANQLGGVFNPRANIQAILPDYLSYYRSHPTLVPGAAGAAVERSGEGAQYYAQGYQKLPGTPAGGAAPGGVYQNYGGSTVAPVQAPAPAVHTGMDTRAFSNTLINAMRSGGGLTPAALLSGLRAATAHLRTGAA